MKNVQRIVFVSAMTVVIGMQSCSKEKDMPVASAQPEETVAVTGGNIIQAAVKPRLVKAGSTTLQYFADGRLSKVIYQPNSYVQYAYGTNSVFATAWINNVKYSVNTIYLNASGNCYQSNFKTFDTNGNESKQWTWKYEYNGNKLVKQVDAADADQRSEFIYDADNNLKTIKFYGSDGTLRTTASYSYAIIVSPYVTADKNRINPETAELEQFQNVYGKFSDNLAKRVLYKNTFSNTEIHDHFYSYAVNADGYITTKKYWKSASGHLEQTDLYEYAPVRKN